MEYVNIARLGKPFGLKGESHAFSLTSFPELRFKKGRQYALVGPKGDEIPVTLSSFSLRGEALTLGFKEIASPEEAAKYNGYVLCLSKEDAPMPEGYVRYGDLYGFLGKDDEGKVIGTLIDVLENAPTPSLKFKTEDNKVFYVPFIDSFVGEISYADRTIVIHVCEGML